MIKIKPSHKGLLHKDLGVPAGKPIPAKKLAAAKKNASPAEKKRIVFAQNAKKFNHKKMAEGGLVGVNRAAFSPSKGGKVRYC